MSVPNKDKKIVSRQRIFDRINVSISDKALYLSAPAGYGNTTALASWVHQSDLPCTWYSLDETDNNPLEFIRYLAKSITLAVPEFKSEFLNNITDAQIGFEALIIHLQNINKQFVIILDDFHLINNKIIINQILRLIKYQVAKIAIASRFDLITEFEEMLLRQKLDILTQELLGFDENDIKQFLNNKGRKLGFDEGFYRTISDYGEDVLYLLDDFKPEKENLSVDLIDYFKQIHTIAKKYSETIKKVKQEENKHLDITHREMEILLQLSGAKSNQEIADVIYLSIQTVKNHTQKIYKKLGVSNRREAVTMDKELNII